MIVKELTFFIYQYWWIDGKEWVDMIPCASMEDAEKEILLEKEILPDVECRIVKRVTTVTEEIVSK